MRLVYICSPLRGDIEQNIRRAQEYCAYAADCGMLPLVPHTIFTQYLDDSQPEQRAHGLQMGLELLKRCDEMWIMGNTVSERMQDEITLANNLCIPRLYVPDKYVQSGYKIRQENRPFSYVDCIPSSEKMDYKNQILVLKPEAYGKDAELTADDSLWVAQFGNGCTWGARGQSIFAENLLSGRHIQWERSDFYGVVEPLRLFSWTSDKPVINQRVEEIIQHVKPIELEPDCTAEEDAEVGL